MATWVPPSGVHNPATGTVPPVTWGDALNAAFDLLALTPQASASHSTTQSATTAVNLTLAADTEGYDNDAMHSTVTNNSRMTAKTAGAFECSATISFAANATGQRSLGFAKNGGTPTFVMAIPNAGAAVTTIQGALSYSLAVNDYIEAVAYQDSGGGLNVTLVQFAARLTAFS